METGAPPFTDAFAARQQSARDFAMNEVLPLANRLDPVQGTQDTIAATRPRREDYAWLDSTTIVMGRFGSGRGFAA